MGKSFWAKAFWTLPLAALLAGCGTAPATDATDAAKNHPPAAGATVEDCIPPSAALPDSGRVLTKIQTRKGEKEKEFMCLTNAQRSAILEGGGTVQVLPIYGFPPPIGSATAMKKPKP
jgi:hypothetical protein